YYDIIVPSQYSIGSRQPVPSSWLISFEEKVPSMFWRGSSTGGALRGPSCNGKLFHRQRAVELARKVNSDTEIQDASFLDFAFTEYKYCETDSCEWMDRSYGPLSKQVPFSDNWLYAYLFDIDGNSWSQRFEQFLWGNSLVFRAGIFGQWFDGWLQEWKHFIPVSLDFDGGTNEGEENVIWDGDLMKKFRWAQTHEEEVKR
ncbi:glycosyltransferase family 90 protein, partial [Gonapodya prolifera JEL478]